MKKVNFDSLTNLKAPDSWIENAINVPKMQKKKPLAFLKYSRTLAAVACLVIVSAVCLSVYLTNDRVTPPITPNASINNQNNDNTENKNENNSKDTQNSQEISPTDSKNTLDSVLPDTGKETIEPSEKPSGTTKPTQNESEKPTVKPVSPSETIEPSEAPPTQEPTTLPVVKPTIPSEKPKPTVPPTHPDDETPPYTPPQNPPNLDGDPGSPGTPPPQAPSYVTFSITVDSSFVTSGERIYCNITDSNGSTVLTNLPVYIYQSGGKAFAICDIHSSDVAQQGNYTCHFYSQQGYEIGSNTQYIS